MANGYTGISYLLLFIGLLTLAAGLTGYWISEGIPQWSNVAITFGILFLVSAIVFISLSQQYQTK